eukprot:SAG31_NODE_512_length_14721_cov_17.995623_12_plen_53_part_00
MHSAIVDSKGALTKIADENIMTERDVASPVVRRTINSEELFQICELRNGNEN